MRTVHFSRLLDIVSGSAFAGAKTKVQKSAIYRDFDLAKLNDARFREIIAANLPAFYIVDIPLIAKEIANGLVSDPKRFISKRFTQAGPAEPGEADFSLEDLANTEGATYTALISDLNTTLTQALKSDLSSKSFESVYTKLDVLYNKLISDLARTGQSYTKYRNAAARYGFDMRKLLAAEGTFIASDGSKLVSLKPGQLVVIAPTFDAAVRKVNDALLKPAESLLENKYNIVVTKNNTGFKIGNLVNAGHTSAVTSTGDIIGVNMPSAQEVQFRLSGSPKSFELDRQLGELYFGIDYSVVFNQNYSSVGGNLLNMQFAFVISQPAALNTNKLRVDEQRRIKAVIEKELLPSLEEQLKRKLSTGILDPTLVSASPTLVKYIEQMLLDQLQSKKTAPLKKQSSRSKKDSLTIPAVFNTAQAKKLTATKKQASITKLKVKAKAPATVNLASLQSLLNASLVERVKQNMGRGDRRDILNLRSGRFAESVKVERLSESRQGMITAFYTYMKNPYATFSEGGRQQSPRSRDPKLLISKSIREIAAQEVANRMRAVLV